VGRGEGGGFEGARGPSRDTQEELVLCEHVKSDVTIFSFSEFFPTAMSVSKIGMADESEIIRKEAAVV
jgi:hypothetical protein